MAPESTRSSSSTASRRLRGLLRRTLRVVRPISDTLAALGAAGQARRIAWTRSTVAQGTTPPLICRGARRHRCLPTYALAELPRKLAVLRRECERIGRDPAPLRATEEPDAAAGERERIFRIGPRRQEGAAVCAVREAHIDGHQGLARPVELEHEPAHLARAGGVEGVAHPEGLHDERHAERGHREPRV